MNTEIKESHTTYKYDFLALKKNDFLHIHDSLSENDIITTLDSLLTYAILFSLDSLSQDDLLSKLDSLMSDVLICILGSLPVNDILSIFDSFMPQDLLI